MRRLRDTENCILFVLIFNHTSNNNRLYIQKIITTEVNINHLKSIFIVEIRCTSIQQISIIVNLNRRLFAYALWFNAGGFNVFYQINPNEGKIHNSNVNVRHSLAAFYDNIILRRDLNCAEITYSNLSAMYNCMTFLNAQCDCARMKYIQRVMIAVECTLNRFGDGCYRTKDASEMWNMLPFAVNYMANNFRPTSLLFSMTIWIMLY